MRALAKKTALLAIVLLFAGCSLVRIGYSYGESLTYWWLDSYVDFEDGQKIWFKDRITHWFDWHRKTQLNDYVSLLTQEQQRLQHKVTPAEVALEYEKLQTRAVTLLDRALPELADLALSLQPSQIEHIEKKHASNNETYRKDYLRGDMAQRQQFRYKKVMEQAEYWFGSFSREQQALIRKASGARSMNNELRMAVRLKQQRELIRILKKVQTEKPPREVVVLMFKEYTRSVFEQYGGIEHRAYFDASREEALNLTAVVINCTTQKQKDHAIKRLQQWIDVFHEAGRKAA